MEQERAAKRRKRIERELQACKQLLGELQACYCGMKPEFLWDTGCSWNLPRPSRYFGHNESPTYGYVGRRCAESLYHKVLAMQAGNHMQVLGAKGSGKSTLICTMSGFLQAGGMKRVVYLRLSRFVAEPEKVLRDALLMSCREDEQCQDLLTSAILQDLIDWCEDQPWGSLLFMVDDWDKFEDGDNAKLEKDILAAASGHMLVKVSSVNSRAREIWSRSDKGYTEVQTFFFDGPFFPDELKCWIGQSTLEDAHLTHLDRLTGGMPRLLYYYEEAKADEAAFLRGTDMYSKSLHKFFVDITTVQQLRAAMELLTTGGLSYALSGKEMTCFYRDEQNRFYLLSPQLRSLAERLVMEKNAELLSRMVEVDMHTWVAAVRIDLHANGLDNPARVGWNIEGLVIAMIKFRQKLFDQGFKHWRTYEHGGEKLALDGMPLEQLEGGVLFVPAAFNEKAVDVVFLKLVDKELIIFGVQITIAQWKAKSKKESHQVWQTEVLPKWNLSSGKYDKVQQTFYYVMPEGVHLDDISEQTEMKSFEDIDRSLAEFDRLVLQEPKKMVKEELKLCAGLTRNKTPCQNKAYVAGEYRCAHHKA